jgi:hypothetical protein
LRNKRRKSDEDGDEDEDEESEAVYLEELIHANESEIDKLRNDNTLLKNDLTMTNCNLRKLMEDNQNIIRDYNTLKTQFLEFKSWTQSLADRVNGINNINPTILNNLNFQIVEETVITNVDKEVSTSQPAIADYEEHTQITSNVDMTNGDDWVEDPPIMDEPDNNQPNVRTNDGATGRQHFRPIQVIANNNSNNMATINSNSNENNTRRNNWNYNRSKNPRQYNNNSRQDNNRAQLNEAPVRINHNSVNSRSSHVYMRNNDLIIGSQSGLRNTQNIAANNRQNGGSGKNGIYLGNVVCGTRFKTVKDMLNLMNINFTDLYQLNNRHGYFQSYYFKVPDNKLNMIFDPRNWEKDLAVRKFV